jgi:hypothetical protein
VSLRFNPSTLDHLQVYRERLRSFEEVNNVVPKCCVNGALETLSIRLCCTIETQRLGSSSL